MKQGCFICPIHDNGNDFDYGMQFWKSAVIYDMKDSFCFVFSNEIEKVKFEMHCKERELPIPALSLVYPADLKDCHCPVSMKKFYGLRELGDSYDYLVTVDCESQFVRSFSAGEMMDGIFSRGGGNS